MAEHTRRQQPFTAHDISSHQAAKELGSNPEAGLSGPECALRQKKYGKNELAHKKKANPVLRFLGQFNDFMIIVLIIAAIVSLGISFLQHDADFVDPIIILAIVVFNALLGTLQESKAEKALEALEKMTSPHAKVLRDGKMQTILSEDLVVGDVLFLEAGDAVSADARLVSATGLKADESSITGESVSVDKDAGALCPAAAPLGDRHNMVFASTVITQGRGKALVTATGMDTQVGQIAGMILDTQSQQTPLQKKLGDVGKVLGIGALCICGLIFVIGIFRGISVFEMFMTAVSLAVAAIPEGLPAIVTIMLALGVTRIAKKNAIIRKLPAVETLGSASVICSDKTGTLTQNKMTVTAFYGDKKQLLTLCALCNNSVCGPEGISGEPTETALVAAAQKEGLEKNELDRQFARMKEIPFDSGRKLMTTVHIIPSGYRIITKGAPDVLLKKCVNQSDVFLRENEKMAQQALRVIAVAYRDVSVLGAKLEENLTFAGLVGMIDPPRPEVSEAVQTCRKAGIKPVMITGDHVVTAKAIARDIGILRKDDEALSGEQLDAMSQEELEKKIFSYSVFARVSPAHKVKIVKAFQKNGSIVAMTGDGVNDAPALKAADIGCAMGKSGTDVAKGASDMVLTDDNFTTIVAAVKEGRGIYDNIKKAVHFLLSSNIGEIITVFVGILLGFSSPLLAIQLLWVNLITDSLPAIALGFEPPEEGIMKKPPRSKKKGIFSDGLWFTIITEGSLIGVLALFAFNIGMQGGLDAARTMTFAVLSISQLFHAFNVSSSVSIFKRKRQNPYLVAAFFIGLLLQCVVIMVPALAVVFKVTPLNLTQWLTVAALSASPILLGELEKIAEKPKRK